MQHFKRSRSFVNQMRQKRYRFARAHSNTLDILFPPRSFWQRVFRFSVPIALQSMSTALLAIVDISVISSMGETTVAAVSLAGQVSYVTSLLAFGITSGASILLSRAFGKKDSQAVKKNFAIMMFFSLLVSLAVTVISMLSPTAVLSVYTDKEELIREGTVYLLIAAPTFTMNGFFNGMAAYFRSANQPMKPMIAVLITVLIKTGLNFLFIFGCGIVPSMGIAGAALASLLAYSFEVVFYVVMMCRFRDQAYVFSVRDVAFIRWKSIKPFLREIYPVILNEGLWGVGLSAFSAVFGRMSVIEASAVSVAQQLENLCNSFFQGVGIGACVSISYLIGREQYEEAKHQAGQYAASGFYVGLGVMLFMLGIDKLYVTSFFKNLSPETVQIVLWLVVVYAMYMPFRSMASSLIMGVLRAGGDSKKAMCYDVLPIYLWSLPVGIVTGIVLHWSVIPVLMLMQFKRVIKCGFALHRLISRRWIHLPKSGDAAAQSR